LTQWANLNAPERFRLLKRRYYGLCSHRSVIPNRARKPKSPHLTIPHSHPTISTR
jgi:hypothetical protein